MNKLWVYYMGVILLAVSSIGLYTIGTEMVVPAAAGVGLVLTSGKSLRVRLLTVLLLPLMMIAGLLLWIVICF
ncbi:MAG: hypothetical protein EOP52_07565 [Sphingobacteriales bacterium]|nr:MAG: hypothetical protein EOP52_07565 [Sphingobacteriales bacterium]